MAHLAPISLSELRDDDIRAQFEHYRQTRGFTPNSIMTMVRRPDIVRAFMALNLPNDTMATALEPLPVHVAQRAIGPVGWEPGKHG